LYQNKKKNFAASSQIVEPLIGILAPAPPNLLTIRGPIYVEPSALQPLYGHRVPGIVAALPLNNYNDLCILLISRPQPWHTRDFTKSIQPISAAGSNLLR
jgi:hypothetical protein